MNLTQGLNDLVAVALVATLAPIIVAVLLASNSRVSVAMNVPAV